MTFWKLVCYSILVGFIIFFIKGVLKWLLTH